MVKTCSFCWEHIDLRDKFAIRIELGLRRRELRVNTLRRIELFDVADVHSSFQCLLNDLSLHGHSTRGKYLKLRIRLGVILFKVGVLFCTVSIAVRFPFFLKKKHEVLVLFLLFNDLANES